MIDLILNKSTEILKYTDAYSVNVKRCTLKRFKGGFGEAAGYKAVGTC